MVRRHILSYVVLAGLLLVVGLSPFAFGAVHPVFYTTFQVATFSLVVLAVIGSVFRTGRPARGELRVLCMAAASFGLLAAFQLLPLPTVLLRLVSPNTVSTVGSALPWKEKICGATISLYPLGTQLSAFQYLSCFGVFIMVITSFGSRRRRFFLAWSLTAIGLALALVGLYQHWHSPGRIYGFWQSVYGGAYFGPFVNRNHFAGYLAMVLPISAALIFIRRMPGKGRHSDEVADGEYLRWGQVIALLCFLVMFIAVVTSLSRGGMVAVGAAGCVLSAVAWRKAATRRAGFCFAVVFVGAFLLGACYAGPELLRRLGQFYADLTNPAKTSRVIAATRTLELYGRYPLFGTGLGTFSAVFTSVQTPELGLGLYRYAHNDWVQLVAETGLSGLVIAFVFVASVLRLAHRRLSQGRTGSGWWLTLGCTASLAAVAVHSIFDFNLHIPSNAYLASAVAGLLCVSALSTRNQQRGRRLAHARPALALISVLCVAIAMGAASYTALAHYSSTALLPRSETPSLREAGRLLLAHRRCPRNPRPLHMLSQLYTASARQARRQQRRETAATYYREAIAYGKLAIEMNPTSSLYHERLAWLLAWGGGLPTEKDLQEAERHFRLAVHFDPAYPDWVLSLARFYLKTGRFSKADPCYAKAVTLNPALGREVIAELDEAGTTVERLQQILPRTVQAHVALGAYLQEKGETAAAGRSYALACELASDAPIDQKVSAAIALARCDQADAAKRYLENWMRTDGRLTQYLKALSEIARLHNDD